MNSPAPVIARHAFAVVGGGVFGSAFAYGLARLGHDVALLDEGDGAFRAARGNFGLLWVQGKGLGCSAYAKWTRLSSDLWSELAGELAAETGIDVEYQRRGGFTPCHDDKSLARLAGISQCLEAQEEGRYSFDLLDGADLRKLVPSVGPRVAGGVFCPQDGHVNPLALLHALHAGFVAKGGTLRAHTPVSRIETTGSGFLLATPHGAIGADRLIIAAGLGGRALAAQVGIDLPVAPNRGQVLVTECLEPTIPLPSPIARQMGNGSVQIGYSEEDVGFDRSTTLSVLARIAAEAAATFPILGRARIVRTWGCLRTLTPDRFPVYERTRSGPTAFAAVAHSGVTLAAAHVYRMAGAMAEDHLPEDVHALDGARFHV